jgi:hypothetical protein
MGRISSPAPVKLFTGILTSVPRMLPDVERRLEALFGPVDDRSESFPFDSTRYYDDEMGTPITRLFCSFQRLIHPQELAGIKIASNGLEAELARNAAEVRRPANLDPGYLEESKIVLASTKNFYHRILLADGIYGEVTLHYSANSWQAFPWSFPDFRSGRYDAFFSRMRSTYRLQLRAAAGDLGIDRA